MVADPAFRTERARKASANGNGTKGVLTRLERAVPKMDREELEHVIDIADRALTASERRGGPDDR